MYASRRFKWYMSIQEWVELGGKLQISTTFRGMNIQLFKNTNNPQNLEIGVYVLHVKKGYESRAERIQRELSELGISFEYILDWDKNELNEEQLSRFFAGTMHSVSAATSCASKHIESWSKFSKSSHELALILEDDIIPDKHFLAFLTQFVEELIVLNPNLLNPVFISLENSGLQFVPAHQLEKNKFLYPVTDTRCAGAYLINRSASELLLHTLESYKMDEPVDWWLKRLAEKKILHVLWSHPTIAEQGSHNGHYASSIDHKTEGVFRKFSWILKRFYKNTLNSFR